jgi:hypothetical protein
MLKGLQVRGVSVDDCRSAMPVAQRRTFFVKCKDI